MTLIRKKFHIGDILSVTLGYELSPRGAEGSHALIAYLLGHPYDHRQLGDAVQCRNVLYGQFPELATFRDDEVPPQELLHEWLRRRCEEYGEYHFVEPIRRDLAPTGVGGTESFAAP